MNIRKFAVQPVGRLHLRDANDELMYTDDNKPIVVNLFGPGSKEHAKATAAQNNRVVERLRRRKAEQTAEHQAAEKAEFLIAVTHSTENLSYDDLTGDEMLRAVYTDPQIGFIADQISRYLSDWANFTKGSPQSSPSTSVTQLG